MKERSSRTHSFFTIPAQVTTRTALTYDEVLADKSEDFQVDYDALKAQHAAEHPVPLDEEHDDASDEVVLEPNTLE
jgi:hypothetical protein